MTYKHGMAETPEFHAWQAMIQRCCNPNVAGYHRYGGRGIRVCDRWLDAFRNFLDDMGLRPTPAHSLDRIDVNGHYEPSNCRWATTKEQARNRRPNVWLVHNGERKILADWAKQLGIGSTTLRQRVDRWGEREALAVSGKTTPAGERHGNCKLSERTVREMRAAFVAGVAVADLAERYGVSKDHARRVCSGKKWSHLEPTEPETNGTCRRRSA